MSIKKSEKSIITIYLANIGIPNSWLKQLYFIIRGEKVSL